ncbi:LapA family protein [Thalassotalea sp. 1_MG-2023]|uniref:LapA family protein n=1 Tax=Thalassotalea sp. 1_MG-2023 TaxID=3062680 RepID=UPI0026E3ACA5|nr:LapA family protein [Thalassotalea sp. 1_MG-2023]MDO6426946.1 LapA family protein [Thalassotalea sp. 1_MG-2023]
MRLYITVIFIVLLLLIAFVFGSQNNQDITLNYLIAKQEMTVATAVSLFTVIGFFIGTLFSVLWKLTMAMRKRRKHVEQIK